MKTEKVEHLTVYSDFDSTVMAEVADAQQKKDFPYHKNLTHLPFVTIDSIGDQCLDDALYAQPFYIDGNYAGYDIMIAISDVPQYIKQGSFLDEEARRREHTFFYQEEDIPMIPFELSYDLCSLVENQPRAVIITHIRVTSRGISAGYGFERAIIKSRKQLSYTEATAIMDKKSVFFGEDISTCLQNLHHASFLLKNGYKSKKKLSAFQQKKEEIQGASSRKLIEEMMIQCNKTVAKFLDRRGAPAVYRVQEGRKLRARYDTENIGHASLNLDFYVHATSPVRRYPDYLNQCALIVAAKLNGYKEIQRHGRKTLFTAAAHFCGGKTV